MPVPQQRHQRALTAAATMSSSAPTLRGQSKCLPSDPAPRRPPSSLSSRHVLVARLLGSITLSRIAFGGALQGEWPRKTNSWPTFPMSCLLAAVTFGSQAGNEPSGVCRPVKRGHQQDVFGPSSGVRRMFGETVPEKLVQQMEVSYSCFDSILTNICFRHCCCCRRRAICSGSWLLQLSWNSCRRAVLTFGFVVFILGRFVVRFVRKKGL